MAVGGVVIRKVVTDLNSKVQEMDFPDSVKSTSQAVDVGFPKFYDGAFLLLFVFMVVGLWFSAYMIDTHPIFFVIAIILVFFFTLITMLLGNTFSDMFTDSSLSAEAASFTLIPFFMANIVPIMVVVAFVTGFILYSKLRNPSGG